MALTASDPIVIVDVAVRPAWTSAAPLGLVLLVGLVDFALYDDPAEAAALLGVAAMMAAGAGALTHHLKGMSVHELLVAMALPVLLSIAFGWFAWTSEYFPTSPLLGFVELVCVPVTVVALRRAAFGGAMRYIFAMTVTPVFLISIALSIMLLAGAFPAISEFLNRTAAQDDGGTKAFGIPLLIVALASGWIWYRLFRLLDRIFQGSPRTDPVKPGQ